MTAELTAMFLRIGLRAAQSVLFIGPKHHPHGPARAQTQLVHEPDCFPGRETSTAIILRTLAYVPGIEVTADQYDLSGLFATDDFCDHIARLHVLQEFRRHFQMSDNARATVLPALQLFRIFNADRRVRYLRHAVAVH